MGVSGLWAELIMSPSCCTGKRSHQHALNTENLWAVWLWFSVGMSQGLFWKALACATCAIAGCPGCGVNRLLTSMRLWVTAHSLTLRVPVCPVLYLSSSAGYYFIFTLYAKKHECSLFIHSEIKIPKQKLFWGVDSHPPGRRMGQGRALLSPCE